MDGEDDVGIAHTQLRRIFKTQYQWCDHIKTHICLF